MTKEASSEELERLWKQAKKFWDDTAPHVSGEWAEASFLLAIFRQTLRQLNFRLPRGIQR